MTIVYPTKNIGPGDEVAAHLFMPPAGSRILGSSTSRGPATR